MLIGLGTKLALLRFKLPLIGPVLVRIDPESAILQLPAIAMQTPGRLLHHLLPGSVPRHIFRLDALTWPQIPSGTLHIRQDLTSQNGS